MRVMAVHSLDPSVLTTQSIRASVIIADLDLRVMHVEGPAFDRHGYRPQDWPGRSLNEVLPAGLMAELEPRYRAALAGEPQSFDYWSHDGSGAYWARITPVRGENGAVTSVVAVMQEVTERLGIVEDLSRSEARLRESERMVGVGSWEWVPETRVLTFSSGFARLLGLATAQELDAEAFWGLLEPEDREILSQATRACLRTGVASSEFHARGADGGLHTFAAQAVAVDPPDGQPRYLRGAILDVTQEREAERERLDAVSLFRGGFDASPIGMAMTDPRTGSYTRVNDALCTLLQRPRDELLGLGVDSVTHPDDRAGNEEMRRVLRDPGVESHHVEKRYLRPDGSSVWVIGHVTSVRDARGSLGALFSQIIDITDRKEHEAQFETQVNDALWLGRIRDAIDNDRLVLYSQPIVDLLTGETVQQELLLRMRSEDGSIIAPGEFLPIAERYGLISEIDRWVIRQAVNLAAQGEATEFNLSGASISDPDIVRELAAAINETGADPALMVVEVTETTMMNQLDAGRRFAEQVTALGCRLALDDFGTKFASLSYLKHIPAQLLKIDIEFVRDLTHSDTDERLVRGIIGIAREFDQTTVAEGIEDQATLIRLRELGVHLGQGYLFGRPQPLSDAAPIAPRVATQPARQPPGLDPIDIVRSAFDAFAGRDLDTMLRICHPDIVLRPHQSTTELTGRQAPYRGHDGLRAYLRDVRTVWNSLTLTPTAFRPADQSVIVFGRAEARSGTETDTVYVLWVWQLRDGLIASIEVFQTSQATQHATPRHSRPPPARRKRSLPPTVEPGARAGAEPPQSPGQGQEGLRTVDRGPDMDDTLSQIAAAAGKPAR